MTASNTQRDALELWNDFRASERPILEFIRHVNAQPDPDAESERLWNALSEGERAALGPEIEAEKARRDAWFARRES